MENSFDDLEFIDVESITNLPAPKLGCIFCDIGLEYTISNDEKEFYYKCLKCNR